MFMYNYLDMWKITTTIWIISSWIIKLFYLNFFYVNIICKK
jgi:hypothetical protein